MTILTAAQITSVREIIGDNVQPYRLSDTTVCTQYEAAEAAAPDTSLIYPYTYVYCLRRLWAVSRLEVDRQSEFGDRVQHSQIAKTTKDMLDYWEIHAGVYGGAGLTAGAIALGLDDRDDTG